MKEIPVTAECPVMLPDGAQQQVVPVGDGAVDVHVPDWVAIPGADAVRCGRCDVVHVGHQPTERQHARYIAE